MPKPDAAADLAARMLQALERLRGEGGDAYPPTRAQLAALAGPDAPPDLAAKAFRKKSLAERFISAKNHPDSPVALAEDAARLAESARLVEFALGLVCTPEKRLHAPQKLVTKVAEPLRPAFAAALQRRIDEKALPPSVGVVVARGKAQLYRTALPPPAVELSGKLVRTLEEMRAAGGDAYPPTLRDLAARADPAAPPALVKQAAALGPFADRAMWAAPGKPDAPAAPREDLDALLVSPALLRFALAATTSPRRPAAPPDRLAARLAADLRGPFAEAVRRAAAAGALPPGVGVVERLDGPELYLNEHAPPAWALARVMLLALHECKRRGDDYPPPLAALARRADPSATFELTRQAAADKAFTARVVFAAAGDADGPVALAEDAAVLAADPRTLEAALAAARSPDHQAVSPADAARKVPPALRAPFADALAARLAAGALPPAVGCLRIKKKPHLFLLRDLAAGGAGERGSGGAGERKPDSNLRPDAFSPPLPRSPAPPLDFEDLFDAAFDRLDRQFGSFNLVNLAELRRAVPADRAAFDAGLHRLRRAGRYTLSAAEGRHGVAAEEREAGVVEDGVLLLFASRRRS